MEKRFDTEEEELELRAKEQKAFERFKKKYETLIAKAATEHGWIVQTWMGLMEIEFSPYREICERDDGDTDVADYFHTVTKQDLSQASVDLGEMFRVIERNFPIFLTAHQLFIMNLFVKDWMKDMESCGKDEIKVLFPGRYPKAVIEEYHRILAEQGSPQDYTFVD